MWSMIYPILIIVAANTIYNICAKSTPKDINSFAVLSITYLVAAVLSFIMFFVTAKGKNIFTEFTKANWAPFVLGIVIVGLELGYILAYRNEWKMNTVSVTANITLAVILIFVLQGNAYAKADYRRICMRRRIGIDQPLILTNTLHKAAKSLTKVIAFSQLSCYSILSFKFLKVFLFYVVFLP